LQEDCEQIKDNTKFISKNEALDACWLRRKAYTPCREKRMGKRIILILAVVISTRFVRAEKAPWASDSVPAAIKARGRMLEEYDVAPWHAADAVQAFEAGERQRSTLLCKKEPQRLDGCIRAPQSGERQISDSL
jgi:hypothetical protein